MTDQNKIKEIAIWATEMFGRIDQIVNNAGINQEDYTDKTSKAKALYRNDLDAKKMLEFNLLTVLHYYLWLNTFDLYLTKAKDHL